MSREHGGEADLTPLKGNKYFIFGEVRCEHVDMYIIIIIIIDMVRILVVDTYIISHVDFMSVYEEITWKMLATQVENANGIL